jgi:hypothetical protein
MPANPFAELWEVLDGIEARLDALEKAMGQEKTRSDELANQEGARSDELAKVAWAVAHGRKRPW